MTEPRDLSPVRALLVDLGWAVGLPIAVYAGARAAGLTDLVALAAATVTSVLRLAVVAALRRRLDGLALFMTALYGASLVLSLWTGQARILLVKDSVPEALFGLLVLGGCLLRRPVLLAAARRLYGADRVDPLWRSSAGYRRALSRASLLWGFCFVGFAALRVPIVLLAPIDVAVAVVNAAFVVVFGTLLAGTLLYGRRLQARAVS